MYWDRWIRKIFEEIEEEFKRMERMLDKEFSSMKVGETFGPYVYGFSITMGPEGKPVVRTFGNIPPVQEVEGFRTPFVDVMVDEKTNEVKVIAEMPGVDKNDIDLRATEKRVDIRAERGDRKYKASVDLPIEVDVKSAKARYNNGVLEVTFKAKREVRPSGTKINIE